MKNKILKYGLLTFLWLVYTLPAMAYPGSPESGENEDETGSPIDDWELSLLLIAVILGAYFLMNYRKKTESKTIKTVR